MYLDDVLHSVTESAYDANGNILNSTQKTISNGSEITTSTAYVYDAAGNPIRVTYEFDGVGTVTENSYDSAGKLVSAVTCDLLGHLTKREEHSWNEAGAELVSTYNPAGDLISTTAHTYDEAGNVLTSETYDPEGNPVQRTIYTYQKFNIPIK
jgi:YD repeat-containing protein